MDGYDVVNLISYQRLTRDQGYTETGISASRALNSSIRFPRSTWIASPS